MMKMLIEPLLNAVWAVQAMQQNVEKINALSVITSVSLDHTNFLGNTVEEISKEKWILRKIQIPLFFAIIFIAISTMKMR
ncbi:MAG: hypothetical protein ACLR6O_02065 [Eubacterium sp.]